MRRAARRACEGQGRSIMRSLRAQPVAIEVVRSGYRAKMPDASM
jgi:hypothetical protein